MAGVYRNRVQFGCTLPRDLLEKLDERRGMIPRTKYLEALIVKAMDQCTYSPADADIRRGEPKER